MLRVRDVMTSEVITVDAETSFRDIWKLIFKKHINAIPVVNKANEIVGILTKEDILKTLYPDYGEFIKDLSMTEDPDDMVLDIKKVFDKRAKEVMKTQIVFTHPDTFLMRALARMMAHHVEQLPVISVGNKIVGVLTKSDVFYALYGLGKNIVTLGRQKKASRSKRQDP